MYGNSGNDIIIGGDGDDFILGGLGDDIIDAGDGSDWVYLDGGNDVVTLGEGSDYISIFGNSNEHHIINDFNPDEDYLIYLRRVSDLSAGDGDGVINASTLDITDTADGALLTISDTHTILFKGITKAELANDENFKFPGVAGGDSNDVLSPSETNYDGSYVIGGKGNDTLNIGGEIHSSNTVFLFGGAGDDTITSVGDYNGNYRAYLEGGTGNDTLTGRVNLYGYPNHTSNYDYLRYSYDPNGVNANFLTGIVIDGWGDTDTISEFEAINLSPFDDQVITGGGLYEINSGLGSDTIIQGDTGFIKVTLSDVGNHFTGHADALSYIELGQEGGSTIDSTEGVTTVAFRFWGTDNYNVVPDYGFHVDLDAGTGQFNRGDYALYTLIGVENVIGSIGNDIIIGNSLDNILYGGYAPWVENSYSGVPGNYSLDGRHFHFTGTDTFTGGAGADTFIVTAVADFVAYDIENASIITDFEDGLDKLVIHTDAYMGDRIIEQGTGDYANDTIIKYLIPIDFFQTPNLSQQWHIDNPGPHYSYAVILKNTNANDITEDDFATEASFFPEVGSQSSSGTIDVIGPDLSLDPVPVVTETNEATLEAYLDEDMMFNTFSDDGSLYYNYG